MADRKYRYDYPRPMVTTDFVLFRGKAALEVLLIKRGKAPFKGKWALPGGFVRMNEDLPDSALRELKEETGLRPRGSIRQLGAYGRPGRDPRGRTISVVFVGVATRNAEVAAASDAAEAKWFPIPNLPKRLAFDHSQIIRDAIIHKRRNAEC